MRDPASLRAAMELARRERPASLPASFAAELMTRLERDSRGSPLPLPMAVAIACSVVLTAGVVSLLPGLPKSQPEPPSLGIFGSPAAHSPFATP